jgi:hypothetical protein
MPKTHQRLNVVPEKKSSINWEIPPFPARISIFRNPENDDPNSHRCWNLLHVLELAYHSKSMPFFNIKKQFVNTKVNKKRDI